MEENRPGEQERQEIEYRPTHSRRTWRACCLAPMLAVAALLILTVGAGLFGPGARLPQIGEQEVGDEAAQKRRETFVEFGRDYFAIVQKADRINEQAFSELQSLVQGSGSIEDMHAAFRKAADANSRASAELRALPVPQGLLSQSKLRQSVDMMSKAYAARKLACEVLAEWNGDVDDQVTAERYRRHVAEVNQLTTEGLRRLGEAAKDNGLTREDAEKFVPATAFRADVIPWR